MSGPEGTYIKIDRKILQWEWYKNDKTKSLFLHLLLTANIKPNKFQGRTVKRGQLVTSLKSLSSQTGLSLKSVRTALNHLKETCEVACEGTPQYTVITIKNYDRYQSGASKSADKGQTKGKRGANEGQQSKNGKNDKNGKKDSACARELLPSALGDGLSPEEYAERAALLRR